MQIEKSSSTVFTPLADGTAVLLNLDTLLYYSLNRTGAVIWEQIESGRAIQVEELVGRTCESFEVTREDAEVALEAFLRYLAELNFVSISPRP